MVFPLTQTHVRAIAGTAPHLIRFAFMSVGSRSLDDRHYFRDREEQCRKAAAEATDPSARVAHAQLADFYAKRLAKSEDDTAPEGKPRTRRR